MEKILGKGYVVLKYHKGIGINSDIFNHVGKITVYVYIYTSVYILLDITVFGSGTALYNGQIF